MEGGNLMVEFLFAAAIRGISVFIHMLPACAGCIS